MRTFVQHYVFFFAATFVPLSGAAYSVTGSASDVVTLVAGSVLARVYRVLLGCETRDVHKTRSVRPRRAAAPRPSASQRCQQETSTAHTLEILDELPTR